MFRRRLFHWLASAAFALCVSGCAPEDERSRIVTELPREGYALFEVSPGGAQRVAFVVEMRDVKDASFVLLYTPNEPRSSGWFEIDPNAFYPCRHYGPDSTDDVELGCIVPNGHGALVDANEAKSWPSSVLLRHQLGDAEPSSDSSTETKNKAAPGGFYAVMRTSKTGAPIPMAVEAIAMDEEEPFDAPSLRRIR